MSHSPSDYLCMERYVSMERRAMSKPPCPTQGWPFWQTGQRLGASMAVNPVGQPSWGAASLLQPLGSGVRNVLLGTRPASGYLMTIQAAL